jgi:hypothetical protein
LSEATNDIIHLHKLISELGIDIAPATPLLRNNQSCIKIALNPIFHARTKHIEIQYHFIREKIKTGEVQVDYIPTSLQQADFLTKPLAIQPFSLNRVASGVKPLPSTL